MPPKGNRSPQGAMSDDSVSVTSSVMSEMKDEYNLEKILAERRTSGGRQWLVQWEGYPEERSSWEPRSSFISEVPLREWREQKLRIAQGYAKPYDVAAFEKRISAIEKARATRKAKRRAKRIRLRLPVSSEHDELDSSDEAEESADEMLLEGPSHSRRGSLHKIDKSLHEFVIEDGQIARSESLKKAKTTRLFKSPTSDSERGDHLSDNSLFEDLRTKAFNKSPKRLKKPKPGGDVIIRSRPEPPPAQVPAVGANRRQSQPSNQVLPAGADRKQLQPSKNIPTARLDRRQSMPTSSSSRYSGTMNKATGQLKGAVGTGPKRYTTKQPKYQGKPKVQGAAIMGRWDASAKPRKRTTVVPGLVPSSNAKTFGKLSIQRKYEKAGRNEPAPNPENLVFINPKKDTAVAQPINLPERNTSPVKTTWEIYQDRLKNENVSFSITEKPSAAEPQVDEGVPTNIFSGGPLDVTHAAPQPGSSTKSKGLVETVVSVQPTQTSEHQLQEVPFETDTSGNRPVLPSEQTLNSHPETSRKSSVTFQCADPGDLSVRHRHENRPDNDGSFSRPGPKPELSVPTGPRSTQGSHPLFATMRMGYNDQIVGAVIIKGLDRVNKAMLLRTRVEGQLQLWCKFSCLATDYKRYHHEEHSKPFAMGVIEPFWDSKSLIQEMAETLIAHACCGLYLQDKFAVLVYPTGTADWVFIDPEIEASPKLGLKFMLRSPILQPFQDLPHGLLQDQLPLHPMSFPDEPKINTVFRHVANIDYQSLIPQNATKHKDPNTIFLMFPPSRNDEHELVVKFLEANKATIYSSHTPGSWDFFTSHVDTGVILIHPSFEFYHLIPSLPATLKKNINVFSIGISEEPTIDPSSSPPFKVTYTPRFACERLFPHGGAILVTDSVFLADPKAAQYILQFFKEALVKKPAGTWKLICRPGIKDWLAEVADELPEDGALYKDLDDLLTIISPPVSSPVSAYEHKTPLVTPDALLETYDSHPTLTLKAAYLVEFFAGWANCHAAAIRRFHVVHPVVVEAWGERWKMLDLLTPEDFMASYKVSENASGGGDAGRRRRKSGGG